MLGMPLEFRAVTRMQPLLTLYHRRHARFGVRSGLGSDVAFSPMFC